MSTRAFLGSASPAAVPGWLEELPRRPARAVVVPGGLALVDVYPLVHADRGRRQRYADLIAAHPDRNFVTLTDDQALIVTGPSWRRA